MLITAVETHDSYIFTVESGENAFEYSFGKQPPDEQAKGDYLQNCKREAKLLAQHEIDKQAEPTPVEL